MKYKAGDKVRVRQWKAMEREFGLTFCGNIDCYKVFITRMKDYCGQIVTITSVGEDCYSIKEDNGGYNWADNMFEGYAFEYGELIEVSNDKLNWEKRIYVGYLDGDAYPYRVVSDCTEEDFHNKTQFYCENFKYARPYKKHTIVIDNKKIEISEESYQKLKESLLGE